MLQGSKSFFIPGFRDGKWGCGRRALCWKEKVSLALSSFRIAFHFYYSYSTFIDIQIYV
jgi:hypothetical protein